MVGQVALVNVTTELSVELGQTRPDHQRIFSADEVPEEGLQRLPNWRTMLNEGSTRFSWILSE